MPAAPVSEVDDKANQRASSLGSLADPFILVDITASESQEQGTLPDIVSPILEILMLCRLLFEEI
jgi:hypothetical protein